jgi:hypothetical protein
VEEALAAARSALDPARWLEIDYAALCTDPHSVARRAAQFAGLDPGALDLSQIPESFTARAGPTEGGETSEEYRRALAAAGLHQQEWRP